MKKNIAIILILVAVVLCACPSLAYAGVMVYGTSSPELINNAFDTSAQMMGVTIPPAEIESTVTTIRVTAGCAACLGILVPIIVGLITLRMARKKEQPS